MGQLRDKKISHARTWIDPNNPTPLPSFDYDIIYPISVYEAIHRTMDDDSTSLDVELDSIYRLIAGKQDIIEGGSPGKLMTWTSVSGRIGETEILRAIASDPGDRSYIKVPSERAVGAILDLKADKGDIYDHRTNNEIHITPEEREKWDDMTPLGWFINHRDNEDIHITDEERNDWNAKASQSDLDDHITDINNPHNTNAHQVGTYSRAEIDSMFADLRESFFNYVNIEYDDRLDTAALVEYADGNWNPNYVLPYTADGISSLPEVDDPDQTYFALMPSTNYEDDESQKCDIYIKRPPTGWRRISTQEMNPGDLVIRYSDSTMFVWMQGHFVNPFGSSAGSGGGTASNQLWRPIINADGVIRWELRSTDDVPSAVSIRGPAGVTPVKGVDYFDGAPGIGIPTGGTQGDLLVKADDEDYDAEWKSAAEVLMDGIVVDYSDITNTPPIYQELGDDENGLISQKAITEEINDINSDIDDLRSEIGSTAGTGGIRADLDEHIHDYNNPHRTSAASIGAVPTATFIEHTQNFDNPHNVSAAQVGLSQVNNTSDLDKPISRATQEALDALGARINSIVASEGGVTNITWNDNTCTMVIHYGDESETDITIPIIETFSSLYFDDATEELVLVLPNGDEQRVAIENLMTLTGSDSNHIRVTVENGVVRAEIIPGSITGDEIEESVHLRGSPTTATQIPSDDSNKIATTKFVHDQVIDNLISYDASRPLSANMGRILNQNKVDLEDVLAVLADTPLINVVDNLDSTERYAALSANMGRELNLTKAPLVHTSPSSSTFGRATVSLFGHARASDVEPLMDGVADIGTDDGYYARADHRHPTDTTRAPLYWPPGEDNLMEGEPRVATPPADSNDTRIANTEWVISNGVDVISDEHINEAVDRALAIIYAGAS